VPEGPSSTPLLPAPGGGVASRARGSGVVTAGEGATPPGCWSAVVTAPPTVAPLAVAALPPLGAGGPDAQQPWAQRAAHHPRSNRCMKGSCDKDAGVWVSPIQTSPSTFAPAEVSGENGYKHLGAELPQCANPHPHPCTPHGLHRCTQKTVLAKRKEAGWCRCYGPTSSPCFQNDLHSSVRCCFQCGDFVFSFVFFVFSFLEPAPSASCSGPDRYVAKALRCCSP
jgi:hypothetical protein